MAGYWRVDGNAKNAINGTWINSPGKELLNVLKRDLKSDYLPIIAEDLGVITKDVEILRDNYGVHPLTIGLNTKEQIFSGGEKDLKGNLNL